MRRLALALPTVAVAALIMAGCVRSRDPAVTMQVRNPTPAIQSNSLPGADPGQTRFEENIPQP